MKYLGLLHPLGNFLGVNHLDGIGNSLVAVRDLLGQRGHNLEGLKVHAREVERQQQGIIGVRKRPFA